MENDTTTYGFLCGADMEPGRIRRHPPTSASRFVDIGSVSAASLAHLDLPLPDVEEVWGVVVTLPDAAPDLHRVSVTLRRTEDVVQAAVLTDAQSFGALDVVLVEAYYWELPRAWREALAK